MGFTIRTDGEWMLTGCNFTGKLGKSSIKHPFTIPMDGEVFDMRTQTQSNIHPVSPVPAKIRFQIQLTRSCLLEVEYLGGHLYSLRLIPRGGGEARRREVSPK